jgi:D-alanyl-D-alanine carboxypeptidase/D-alanyl-D-alanine-endopeptidase (penicillin-binding protein 4)
VALTLAGLLLALSQPVLAQSDPTAQRLHKLLTNLPQPGVRCSAAVIDLDAGRTICQVNPSSPLIPASNAKLFVIAAAAEQLGPDFAFRTVLARQGEDLVLVGDGDPSLGDVKVAEARGEGADAMLARWADALLDRGISLISGDLVIDESIFDDQLVHPSWEERHLKKWYAAPVGALNYNDNCVEVTIWPSASKGAPVLWETRPKSDLIEIVNRCKSGGTGTPLIDRPETDFRFVVTRRCSKRWPFPPITAPDPGLLTAGALRRALADRGITVAGEIRRRKLRQPEGSLPADCRVLVTHQTPLRAVLTRAGKDSQNLFACCLMKRLGYEWAKRQGHADPQGTWQTGRAALEEFVSRIGRSGDTVTVVDGSGLSRQNRASAEDFVAVLQHLYRHPGRQLFVDSLSVAGADGTLRKRLRGLRGTVHAKTGLLNGARTLSGYAVTPLGRWRAFSVLFNGYKGPAAPFNEIHDQVCRILVTDPPGTSP